MSGARERLRMPTERESVTHKFDIAGHQGYVTAGMFDDGTVGEIFIIMAKEGSTMRGIMDCFSTSVSMSLQYGVPLESLVRKFRNQTFEPSGVTRNPDIPIAQSVVDYIFRWLDMRFLTEAEAQGDAEG